MDFHFCLLQYDFKKYVVVECARSKILLSHKIVANVAAGVLIDTNDLTFQIQKYTHTPPQKTF